MVLAIAVACQGPGGPEVAPGTVTVSDSAGIEIVTNHAAQRTGPDAWRLASTPDLQFGSVDGASDQAFFRIGEALTLPSGDIAVGDIGDREVRVYSQSGRLERRMGGQGEGPGEFSAIRDIISLGGDSLLVSDLFNVRATVFDESGAVVGTFPLTDAAGQSSGSLLGRLPDGSLAASGGAGSVDSVETTRVARGRGRITRLEMDGTFGELLLEHDTGEMIRFGGGTATAPFNAGSSLGITPDGLLTAFHRTYEYRVHGVDGTLLRIVRRDATLRPVTEEELEAWRERSGPMFAMLSSGPDLAGLDVPDTYPAVGEVRVDGLGNVWMSEYRERGVRSEEPVIWSVFDPAGVWISDVSIPATLEVLELGDDYLLARWMDEFNVQYVQRYAIEKGAAEPRS